MVLPLRKRSVSVIVSIQIVLKSYKFHQIYTISGVLSENWTIQAAGPVFEEGLEPFVSTMESSEKQRSQRNRRRERAQEMRQAQAQQKHRQNANEEAGSGEDDEVPPPPRGRERTRHRPRRRKSSRSSSNEEDIIDGFAISSYATLDALEVRSSLLFIVHNTLDLQSAVWPCVIRPNSHSTFKSCLSITKQQ